MYIPNCPYSKNKLHTISVGRLDFIVYLCCVKLALHALHSNEIKKKRRKKAAKLERRCQPNMQTRMNIFIPCCSSFIFLLFHFPAMHFIHLISSPFCCRFFFFFFFFSIALAIFFFFSFVCFETKNCL